MVDPTADVALLPVESSLYNNVQALLQEMKRQSASQKGSNNSGMLRWSLQRRLESDPSCSVSLIQVLVKELEKRIKKFNKISKTQFYLRVIPVLHTLYYVTMQSGTMIPISLYQTAYDCLMKLLILPSPYSAVALRTLRSIKMEMITPGSVYQRRVIAEQNLKTELFTLQEKVFVLADPAVFSVQLELAVKACLEVSNTLRNTQTVEKNVVLRVLQTGLGSTCRSSRLAQTLEALEDHMLDKYFQEVAHAVEESIKHGSGGHANYLKQLQDIYTDILTASKHETTNADHGAVCGTAMPFPEINFHLWRYEDDLWDLLANFALHCCLNSRVDGEVTDKRDSVRSEAGREQPPVSAFSRRKAFKNIKRGDKLNLMREKMDSFFGSSPVLKEDKRRHTARVVVMGDDRVLGRLTKAYHSIREKESKHLILTKKLNLQFYYIPVSDVQPSLSPPVSPCRDEGRLSLASLLGSVDPWYNSNINSLQSAISKLTEKTEKNSNHSEPNQQKLFVLDTVCYYLRCGTQPVNLPLYSVKMTRSSCDVVEEVFVACLEADIPEFGHLKETSSKGPNSRRKRSTVEVFGAVITVSYTKTSLSKREVVKGEAPMAYGVVITSGLGGQDYLTVRFDSLSPELNKEIQTKNISIKTMEHRTLSVCLDKDSRRTYTDVQRIEISPCLDPGCTIQSRFSISCERELALRRYLDQVLTLPINTFTGVVL